MKFGIFGINTGACAVPEAAARVARAAEAAGFESVWTGEHIVLPDPQVPPSPAPPDMPFLDSAVALAYLAAQTREIRLATGIIILPQRNPVELAKELASVDVLSNGRLIFGLGAGYLKPEFDALGSDFATRGARTSEYIEVIRSLWVEDAPSFEGSFVRYSGIQAQPRPVQRPHPPIVVGGMSPPAFRRAVAQGNGWYGFALDPEGTQRCIEGLHKAASEVQRPAELGDLEITITPNSHLDADLVKRFEDLGVCRVVALAPGRSADDVVRSVERTADEVLPAV